MLIKGKAVYENVLQIPEGRSGTFSLEHNRLPAGTQMHTTSFRTAMHAQHRNITISYPHETVWHRLKDEDGIWMTDLPIEQYQHDQVLQKFHGRVLVGGLGLGYAVTALSQKRRVREIVVVERSTDVAALVYEHVKTKKMTLVQADLHEYLKGDVGPFDFGFYDIWRSDGETTFHYTVVPLREASRGKVDHVVAWNEDVMRGQLHMSLFTRLLYLHAESEHPVSAADRGLVSLDRLADDSNVTVFQKWAQPFWRWYRKTGQNLTLEEAQWTAVVYSRLYGDENEYLSSLLGEEVKSIIPTDRNDEED